MIGSNIKRLRTEKGMTQKNLADKLFVSAQAVSRWENDEVEPSLGTIAEMAKIFEVSTDEILGVSAHEPKEEPKTEEPPKAEPQVIVEKEYVYKEPPKQMLALCHQCNSPIYERSDIFREHGENGDRILCPKCHQKQEEKKQREEKERQQRKIERAERRRTKSFWLGGLAAAAALGLWFLFGGFFSIPSALLGIVFSASMFTFVSCCLLANNFVGGMALEIFSWGFVKMPGLIFTLDIDGCLWFIATKILLAILAFLLAIAAAILAIIIGGVVSLFVYPYAITKNINHPDQTNDIDFNEFK